MLDPRIFFEVSDIKFYKGTVIFCKLFPIFDYFDLWKTLKLELSKGETIGYLINF